MKNFEKYFSDNSAVMLLVDPNKGNIVDANKSALQFYGYTHKQICTLNISDINISSQDEIVDQQSSNYVVYKHRLSDHSIRKVNTLTSPVEINDRKLNFIIVIDVTEQKLQEKENKRFKLIADTAIPFVGFANMNKEVFYMNDSMRKALAVPENADLSNYNVLDFYSPQGLEIIKTAFTEIEKNGFWTGENELLSFDGKKYNILQTIRLISSKSGKPEYTSMIAIDITKQKIAEQKIIESEKFHRTLFDMIDGFAYCKMIFENNRPVDFIHLIVNKAFETKTGLIDVVGKKFTELANGALTSEKDFIETCGRVATTQIPEQFEIYMEGLQRWFSGSIYSPEKDHFVTVFDMVNERKRIESEKQELLDRLQKIASRSPGVVYQFQLFPDGRSCFPYMSDSLFGLFGTNSEDVKHDSAKAFLKVLPEDLPGLKASIEKSAKELSPWMHEYRVRHLDGTIHTLLGNSIPQLEKDGSILWHGFMADITQRVKMEEVMRRNEENLQRAEQIGKFGYWVCDMKTSMFEFSKGASLIYGLEGSAFTRDEIRAFRLPEYNPILDEAMRALIEEGKPFDQEYKIYYKMSSQVLDIRVIATYNPADELMFGSIQDITDKKQQEEAIRISESNLKKAQHIGHIGNWTWDIKNDVMTMSDEVFNIMGVKKESFSGKLSDLIMSTVHPEDSAMVAKMYENTIHRGIVEGFEHRIILPDGRVRYVAIEHGEFKTDRFGKMVYLTGIIQDITERKNRENEIERLNNELKDLNQYLQQIRTKERNKLANDVHDQLGQQLVALRFQFDWIKNNIEGDKTALSKKLDYISGIISGMTTDFKKIYNEINPTMLDDLTVIDCFEFQVAMFREKSDIEVRLFFNIKKQEFTKEIKLTLYKALEECLNNIVYYAQATYVSVSLMTQEDEVRLVIEDNGIGFDLAAVDTKIQHGILEVRERVSAVAGRLDIESINGVGTTVEVVLPLA